MDSWVEVWRREERHPFVGWDFSHLDGRMIEGHPPWCYTTRAGELMRASASVLDIDTGGGERLLGLRERWPARVVATEAYPLTSNSRGRDSSPWAAPSSTCPGTGRRCRSRTASST